MYRQSNLVRNDQGKPSHIPGLQERRHMEFSLAWRIKIRTCNRAGATRTASFQTAICSFYRLHIGGTGRNVIAAIPAKGLNRAGH
jgi:hypothetical protein